jgi:hypothetical protein
MFGSVFGCGLCGCAGFKLKEGEVETERNKRNECYYCSHRREVPGNCHIECVKPDTDMIGSEHGIRNGWFMYPLLFDPTWKEKACDNFELHKSVKHAVSDAVSDETNG